MIAPVKGSLALVVMRLLDRLLAESSPDTLERRKIASRTLALPLFQDMGGCSAIKPTGEIVSYLWDTPDDIRTVTDARLQRMVLYQGSLKYPALGEFIPVRPSDGVDCPYCEEISQMKIKAGVDNIVCYCGGLSWLTADELTRFRMKVAGRSWFSRLPNTVLRKFLASISGSRAIVAA